MTINEKPKLEPTEPVDKQKKFDEFLRSKIIEEASIKPFLERIEKEGKIPEFRFKISNVQDEWILDSFKSDIDDFLKELRKAIYRRSIFEGDEIEDIFEFHRIKPEDILIVIDPTNYEFLFHKLDDFSGDWSRFINRPIIINGTYMTIGIDNMKYHKSIEFFCSEHAKYGKKHYPFGRLIENFDKPVGCSVKKCKKKDMVDTKWDSYTVGKFTIGDSNIGVGKQQFIQCYTFRNYEYLLEKSKTIEMGEEIIVTGILRMDATKLGKRNEIPDYYIEMIDINPVKQNKIDNNVIRTIKNKIEANPNYFEKLVDSIFPLAYQNDLTFPVKFLNIMSFITGGSWNSEENIRDTLNSFICGPKGIFKSGIQRALRKKVGKRHMYKTEGKKGGQTHAGWFGTTERSANYDTPMVRYGVFGTYANGMICIDEAQKLKPQLLEDALRHVEEGFYQLEQEGMMITVLSKASISLAQNLMKDKEKGGYNEDYTFFENIGWKEENVGSLFDRIDLVYICPQKDIYAQLGFSRNDTLMKYGVINQSIAEDLELEDYDFPASIQSISEKIDYIHYNYFHEAKRDYKKCVNCKENIENLDHFYEVMIKNTDNIYVCDNTFELRGKNVCKKLLRALAALRLRDVSNESDYRYFSDNCLGYVNQFKESDLINKKKININEIFREMFETQVINKKISKIDLNEIFNRLKVEIKINFLQDENIEEKIDSYIGKTGDLKNHKMRKLLKNNEIFLEIRGYKVISKRGRGNITTIEKIGQDVSKNKAKRLKPCATGKIDMNRLFRTESESEKNTEKLNRIMNELKDIFFLGEKEFLDKNGAIQALNQRLNFGKPLIERTINILIEIGAIVQEKNMIRFEKSEKN